MESGMLRGCCISFLFQQDRTAGLGYILILVGAMTASVSAAIPFFQVILLGQYDQTVFVEIIMYALSEMVHLFLRFLSVPHLFPYCPDRPVIQNRDNESGCCRQYPAIHNGF